jgi:hypothetical protein
MQSPYGNLKYPFIILENAYDLSHNRHLVLHDWVSKHNQMSSVRSGLGQWLQVRVHVWIEQCPECVSRLSNPPHNQFRYTLITISQPNRIGQVFSWLFSYSSIWIHIVKFQQSLLICCVVCNMDYFVIQGFHFTFCISAYQGSQQFCYQLKFPNNVFITQYVRLKVVWHCVDAHFRDWVMQK